MAFEKIILGYKRQDTHFLERMLPQIGKGDRETREKEKKRVCLRKKKKENDGR